MFVTRSTNQRQVQVDHEIENTLHRLWKEARVNTMVVERQQTLKELIAPNLKNQPLCINMDNNVNFELKSGFIHLLPTFNGLCIQSMVCVGMKLNGVDEEHVKLRSISQHLELPT